MRALWLLITLCLIGVCLWWFQSGDTTESSGDLLPDDAVHEEEAVVLHGRGAAPLETEAAPDLGGVHVIHGTVEDAAGKPLANILVELKEEVAPGYLEERPGSWCAPERVGRPTRYRVVATTRSDAEGAFRFRSLPLTLEGYLVHAVGEAPRVSANEYVWHARMNVPLRLVLGEGTPVHVRVVGPDGQGRPAFLSGYAAREGPAWTPCSFQGEATNSEGRATIHLPDGAYDCEVHAPGLGSQSGVLLEVPQSRELVIALGRHGGARVEGRITDTAGKPISGAHVLLACDNSLIGQLSRSATTAANGTYGIAGLPAGRVQQLSAAASGFVCVEDAGFKPELRDGLVLRADVQMIRGGVIEGRIRAPNGTPVAGALVEARIVPAPERVASSDRAVTDGSGRYRMNQVPLGAGSVHVSAAGLYQPARSKAPFVLSEESERKTIDITLARGIPIVGRVVDASGRGVAQAEVRAQGYGVKGWWRHTLAERTTRTDADGEFQYAGLPPSAGWRLTAHTETALSLPVEMSVTHEGDTPPPITLVVNLGATIEGRVLIPRDSGRERLRVHARHDGSRFQTVPLGSNRTFRITGLAPGDVQVYVIDWQVDRISNLVKVKLAWGQVLRDIELKTDALTVIAGIVVDERGIPVPNLELSLRISGPRQNRLISNPTNLRGRFAFPSLPATDHVFTIEVPNERIPGVFAPGDTQVRIVYKAPETVRFEGTVTLPDGTPAGGGHVMVWEVTPAAQGRPASPSGRGLSISAGTFGESFERRVGNSVFEAEVREVVDSLGRSVSVLPMKRDGVEPGEPIEFRLRAGLEVAGIVVDADGAPVPDARVSIAPPGDDLQFHRKNMKSRMDGSFHFGSLSPGPLRLRVDRAPAPYLAAPDLLIEAGQKDLRITLKRGASIRGRVLDPAYDPVPGSSVRWTAPSGASVSTRSGPDGRFELSPIPSGVTGSLMATPPKHPESLLIGASLSDVRAGTEKLELRLTQGALIQGELTGPDGEPVPGAWLSCRSLAKAYSGLYQDRTEGGTHFELGPLPVGRYRIQVQVGAGYLAPAPLEVSAPADELRIIAPKGLTLSGTLVGAERPERYTMLFLRKTADGPVAQGGSVTAAGTFRITLAADEAGTLFFRDNDGSGLYGLAEGVRPSEIPLTVTLQRGLTIEGRFEDYAEDEGGNVYAQAASGLSLGGQVAKDGSFVVSGVPPGIYEVRGLRSRTALEPVKGVRAGARDIVLPRP